MAGGAEPGAGKCTAADGCGITGSGRTKGRRPDVLCVECRELRSGSKLVRQIGLEDSMSESCRDINFSCASWRSLSIPAAGFPAMPRCLILNRWYHGGGNFSGKRCLRFTKVVYENHQYQDVGTFARRVVVRSPWDEHSADQSFNGRLIRLLV
jgi:hypothetical protein